MSRNVLTFQPPLVITRDDIDRVVETLDELIPLEKGGIKGVVKYRRTYEY